MKGIPFCLSVWETACPQGYDADRCLAYRSLHEFQRFPTGSSLRWSKPRKNAQQVGFRADTFSMLRQNSKGCSPISDWLGLKNKTNVEIIPVAESKIYFYFRKTKVEPIAREPSVRGCGWRKQIIRSRCPYSFTNIVCGSSELLSVFVDTFFKTSELRPKGEDANI